MINITSQMYNYITYNLWIQLYPTRYDAHIRQDANDMQLYNNLNHILYWYIQDSNT